jgi:hypothetical protein
MKQYFLGTVIFFIYLFLFSHLEYKNNDEIITHYREPINALFSLVISTFWIITIPIMIINKLRSK